MLSKEQFGFQLERFGLELSLGDAGTRSDKVADCQLLPAGEFDIVHNVLLNNRHVRTLINLASNGTEVENTGSLTRIFLFGENCDNTCS